MNEIIYILPLVGVGIYYIVSYMRLKNEFRPRRGNKRWKSKYSYRILNDEDFDKYNSLNDIIMDKYEKYGGIYMNEDMRTWPEVQALGKFYSDMAKKYNYDIMRFFISSDGEIMPSGSVRYGL